MFGRRAVDLVKELQSAGADALPPYNVSPSEQNELAAGCPYMPGKSIRIRWHGVCKVCFLEIVAIECFVIAPVDAFLLLAG